MYHSFLVASLLLSFSLNACLQSEIKQPMANASRPEKYFVDSKGDTIQAITKTTEQWTSALEPMAYNVLREKGTERAFTGKYHDNKKNGVYACNGCGLALFSSDTKFDSGTGWPSFYAPVDKTHIVEDSDTDFGMKRIEVLCHRCGGHLGHVFNDGPRPTGLRYCMNSVSLSFQPE